MKLLSFSSSYRDCHTGKSKRQPHQLAQVARNTFLPRSCERVRGTPLTSGRVKSGACRPSSAALRSSAAAPSAHTSLSWLAITGPPSFCQKASTSTSLPLTALAGSGTHRSSRHMPSGLSDQPVIFSASLALIQRPSRAETLYSSVGVRMVVIATSLYRDDGYFGTEIVTSLEVMNSSITGTPFWVCS